MTLEPESETMMSHYRDRQCHWNEISDVLYRYQNPYHSYPPRFGLQTRKDLFAILKNYDSVDLVLTVVRFGNYSDTKDLKDRRKAASKHAKKIYGISPPRGKRTKVGMLEMVACITPILLYFGLPCATGEGSRLVIALRIVAEAIGIDGDPRDELRRLAKVRNQLRRNAEKAYNEAFSRGLAPD